MRFRLLFCLLICISVSGFAMASPGTGENSNKCDISGGVMAADTKMPLNNVVVSVVSHQTKEKKSAVTDEGGNYSFEGLKTGNYKVVFQKDGYKSLVKENVFVKEDEGFQISVEMFRSVEYRLIPGIILYE